MKKTQLFLTTFSILASFNAFANLVELESNKPVKAQEINQNFSYIKSIMDSKSIPVSFKVFSSNEVIDNEDFESEFNKVRSLGVEVNVLDSSIVKAEELNIAFEQMALGVTSYDDVPLAQDVIFSTNEEVAYVGTFPVINYTGPTSIEIISSPSKGSLVKNNLSLPTTLKPIIVGLIALLIERLTGKITLTLKLLLYRFFPLMMLP